MPKNAFLGESDFQKIFKDHLRIESFPKSIENLFGVRMRTKVNYSPYYQRHYVWDATKATYFIESILLGTEIPPLVFFQSSNKIEVIDGRQRYETIKRFMDGQLPLNQKGLDRLKELARTTYPKLPNAIAALFLDTKLRIIQFDIIGDPPLDASLEDKIKKEIFRRYNTGITPLRRAELDNAVYDSDDLTAFLKKAFKEDSTTAARVQSLFLHAKNNSEEAYDHSQVLQFMRRMLVQHRYPIRYFARTSGRSENLAHLYDCFAQHDCANPKDVYDKIEAFVATIWKLKEIADHRGVSTNRFFWECLFWAMLVLDQEGMPSPDLVKGHSDELLKLVSENKAVFFADASHYYSVIVERFSCIEKFFSRKTGLDWTIYMEGSEEIRKELRLNNHSQDTETQLSQLGELRVNKPDPSKISVDDILKNMRRRRFLLRPSYQRGEVISPIKASGIIESLLLDVALPPIFVFKRNDGISEVVDGQQRLLTILGFLGEPYLDEKNDQVPAKMDRFPLQKLRVLPELNGKRFEDLSDLQKGRILDFELFVVEIQQTLNPQFNPVDLFVRLNDRPFPIKEHSFEMWNSWAEKDCIAKIRENTEKSAPWFYLRKRRTDDRYRMHNEELYATLVFFEYCALTHGAPKDPAVFSKRGSISARINDKGDISSTLARLSENSETKRLWMDSISRVESFLRKLKLVLIDRDVPDDVCEFLRKELDRLVRSPDQLYAVRSAQDFYFLWLMLSPLNNEMVRFHRQEIKAELQKMAQTIKTGNFPNRALGGDAANYFKDWLNKFHDRFRKQERNLRLTENEKTALIHAQRGRCAESGAPIFVGDDLAVDHKEPLAAGGVDALCNLQITTPEANWRKGPRSKSNSDTSG